MESKKVFKDSSAFGNFEPEHAAKENKSVMVIKRSKYFLNLLCFIIFQTTFYLNNFFLR